MITLALPEGVPQPPDSTGRRHRDHAIAITTLEAYRNRRHVAGHRKRILEYLDRCGWNGSTNDAGWRALGYDTPNQYAPDITEMRDMGLVVWRGDYRKTEANRNARVWVSTQVWIDHHLVPGEGHGTSIPRNPVGDVSG